MHISGEESDRVAKKINFSIYILSQYIYKLFIFGKKTLKG